MEGRPLTKENMEQPTSTGRRDGRSWSMRLDRVRQAARRISKIRFTALLHHVTVDAASGQLLRLEEGSCTRGGRRDVARIWNGLEERLGRTSQVASIAGRIERNRHEASLDPES